MNATIDMIRTAMNNGYLIVEEDGEFTILKTSTKLNPEISTNKLLFEKFSTFEDALQNITAKIDPAEIMWSAVLRYNQGMGPQMKNLDVFKSKDYESAKKIGTIVAIEWLGSIPSLRKSQIIEVRVSPVM